MLTITEIVNQTGIDRSALNRFLKEPDVRSVMGGENTHPSYPEESMPLFCRLAALYEAGEARPKTFAARLRREMADPSKVRAETAQTEYAETAQADAGQQALVRPRRTPGELTVVVPQQITDSVTLLVEILREMATPAVPVPAAPEDRIIEAGEASLMLSCKPERVVRLLRKGGIYPVRPGRWRRSDVLRYIQMA